VLRQGLMGGLATIRTSGDVAGTGCGSACHASGGGRGGASTRCGCRRCCGGTDAGTV